MDKLELTKLQDLQDAYASLCGMTLHITDKYGRFVTRPSSLNDFTRLLFEQKLFNLTIQEGYIYVIRQTSQLKQPIFYDQFSGLKFALAPIKAFNRTEGYIWAGLIIEEQTKELIKLNNELFIEPSVTWLEAFDRLPVVSAEQKELLLKRMGLLAEIVADIMESSRQADQRRREIAIMYEMANARPTQRLLDEKMSNHLFSTFGEADFVGYAEKFEDERYKLSYVYGNNVESLKNAVFSAGEGFLGQIAMTEKYAYWEHIQWDPRVLFFKMRHIEPKCLAAYPVHQDGTIVGILFVGSTWSERLDFRHIEYGEIFSLLLGSNITIQGLREERQKQTERLYSIFNICQVVSSIQDIKRILLMYVEVANNTFGGEFATVIYRAPDSGEMTVVSRNMDAALSQRYVKSVTDRYLGRQSQASPSGPPYYSELPDVVVMEIPIVCEGVVLGVFAAAAANKRKFAEYISFFTALNLVVQFSVGRILEKEQLEKSRFLSHEYMAELKELALKFAEELNLSAEETERIQQACPYIQYETGYLYAVIKNEEVIRTVKDSQLLLNDALPPNSSQRLSTNMPVQIIAIAWKYIASGKKLEALDNSFASIEPELRKRFFDFINGRTIHSWYGRPHSASPDKHEIALTPRESEVLNLVIHGMSNTEIAAKLFISSHTVKNHITKIFEKLGVNDRTQAMAKVYRKGLVR